MATGHNLHEVYLLLRTADNNYKEDKRCTLAALAKLVYETSSAGIGFRMQCIKFTGCCRKS